MPPFREGLTKIDRRLSGELLHFLRDVGHRHRINIVDASYDIPAGSVVYEYPGATADAFEAIARLIPIENEVPGPIEVTEMIRDEAFRPILEDMADDDPNHEPHVVQLASKAMEKAIKRLNIEKVGEREDGTVVEWIEHDVRLRLDEEEKNSVFGREKGFYSLANNPEQPRTFIRTQDDLPFACVSLVVGHSQRTE